MEDLDEDAIHSEVYCHIVFSTLGQKDLLAEDDLHPLHQCIQSILESISSDALAVGGTTNHVHILAKTPDHLSIDRIVQTVKAGSAEWVRATLPGMSGFSWQLNVGVFSVGPHDLQAGVEYIHDQLAHHQAISFEQEFLVLLKEHEIEYDPKDVFD